MLVGMTLDLTDEQSKALARLLRHAIDDDRYPLSPRVRVLQEILDQIQPPAAPAAPRRIYAPPSKGRYKTRG
jgi:hypothetical protein